MELHPITRLATGFKTSGGDGYVGFESAVRVCDFTAAGPRDGERLLMRRTLGGPPTG